MSHGHVHRADPGGGPGDASELVALAVGLGGYGDAGAHRARGLGG